MRVAIFGTDQEGLVQYIIVPKEDEQKALENYILLGYSDVHSIDVAEGDIYVEDSF